MKKLTHFQKTILAEAIYSHLTKLYDDTLEYQEKHPDKNLLIGPKFYTQERDEILRKLKLDFVLSHEWLL